MAQIGMWENPWVKTSNECLDPRQCPPVPMNYMPRFDIICGLRS